MAKDVTDDAITNANVESESEDSFADAIKSTNQCKSHKIITGSSKIKEALKGLYGHVITSSVDGDIVTFSTDDANTKNEQCNSYSVSFDINDLRKAVPHFVSMLDTKDAFTVLSEELGIDDGYGLLWGGTEDDGFEVIASVKPYSSLVLVKSLEMPISTYDGTLTFNGDSFIVWEEPERLGIGSESAGTRTGRYIRVVGNLINQADVPQEALTESSMATPKVNGRKCIHVTIGFAAKSYVLDTNIPSELSESVDDLMLINARPAKNPRDECDVVVDSYTFKDGASPSMYDCLEEIPNMCRMIMLGIEDQTNGYAGDTADVPFQLAAARHGLNVLGDVGDTPRYKGAESKRISEEIVAAASDGPMYINSDGEREFASSAMCEMSIDSSDDSAISVKSIAVCIDGGAKHVIEKFSSISKLSDAIYEYVSIDDADNNDDDYAQLNQCDELYDDLIASVDDITDDVNENDIAAIKEELHIDDSTNIFIYNVDLSDASFIRNNDESMDSLGYDGLSSDGENVYIDSDFAKRVYEDAWNDKSANDSFIENSNSLVHDDDDDLDDGYNDINSRIAEMTLWNGYVISIGKQLAGHNLANTVAEAASNTTPCLSDEELATIYESCFDFDDTSDWDESWEFNLSEPRYHIQGKTPQWFIDSVDLTNAFTHDTDMVDQEYAIGESDDGIGIIIKPTCRNIPLLDGLLESMPTTNDFERHRNLDWVFAKEITNPKNKMHGRSYEIVIRHRKSLMKEYRRFIGYESMSGIKECWEAYIGVTNNTNPITPNDEKRKVVYSALSIGILLPNGYNEAFGMEDCYMYLRSALLEVIRRIRDGEMVYEDCMSCKTKEGCPSIGTRHGAKDEKEVYAACKPVIARMLALRNPQDDFSRMLDEL